MQRILKGQKMGNSKSIPLTEFGIELGRQYWVKKLENGNILISELGEET